MYMYLYTALVPIQLHIHVQTCISFLVMSKVNYSYVTVVWK